MINGEGTRANTSDVASPDPFDMFSPWVDQKSETGDASPALSDYSSCGESDFERYCSANSVMGTASLCSSLGTCNDFLDSDLGSAKSFGFGDDHVLENFGFRDRFGRISGDRSVATLGGLDLLPNGRFGFYNEDVDITSGVSVEEGRSTLRIRNQSKSLPSSEVKSMSFVANRSENRDDNSMASGVDDGLQSPQSSYIITSSHSGTFDEDNSGAFTSSRGQAIIGTKINEENSVRLGARFHEQVHGDLSRFPGLASESGDPFDGREIGTVSEEEGTSSRCEHSDDDGSMFDYGTDDEHKIDLYDRRNLQYYQEPKTENENPLLINSAVAFGSDDWDEFMQETEENNLASVLLYKSQEQQRGHLKTEENLLNSALVALAGAPNFGGSEQEKNVRDIPVATCQVHGTDEPIEDLESCTIRDSLSQEKDLVTQKAPVKIVLNTMDGAAERELHCVRSVEVIGLEESEVSESELLGKSKLQLDPLSGITAHQICSAMEEPRGKETVFFEDHEVNVSPPMVEDDPNSCLNTISKDSPASIDQAECLLAPMKVENLDLKESYDEFVLEMEEILLDSRESHGARFSQSNREYLSQLPQPFRDGSSTASTSGMDDVFPLIQHPVKIDGVEVVGAKQRKGDVSFGERLVGVKEYTLYILRVWSGKDQWEVERRYRDFLALYRQLKTLYANHGWTLPSPWSHVERESRKIFGNSSPDVINERSGLIQECLRSILHSGSLNGTPSTLIWFLSPQKAVSSSSLLDTLGLQSTSAFTGGPCTADVSTLGKTISLVVEILPRKSTKQLLEAQHYTCAGCHRDLVAGKTLVQEFVQTLGWGKPRLCEYTGQLFCASCHTNETAVLPARVLHFWDFTEYPVSQLAKSYLESIYDQPMLCVSAVNPFLFSKVPALLHVMGIRKKIGAMVPYVRCPFRRSIQRGVGSRRYLLESNEFFALRDLVDLSKGAFSALPVMVETISTKILEHITQRCLVCCDVGVPCGAKQACEDPSSLIFPFQEGEVKRCSSCESVFHKTCLRHLPCCPCGAFFEASGGARPDQVNHRSYNVVDKTLNASMRKPDSGSSMGFLSNLFLKARNDNPVILMGSLPSTSF